jgi:hypothetical protein
VVNQPELDIPIVHSFLYADPTPNALQVFSKRITGARSVEISGLPVEQGAEDGVWISADPIRGCIVCNIGESKCSRNLFDDEHRSTLLLDFSVGDLDQRSLSFNSPSRRPSKLEL